MWSSDDITFDMQFDHSEGHVWTVAIIVPGAIIELMGEVSEQADTFIAAGVHIQVSGTELVMTRKNMKMIAQKIMEKMGYDHVIIEGAVRTSGARSGNRPRQFRFP
jgi:hypothetical protein